MLDNVSSISLIAEGFFVRADLCIEVDGLSLLGTNFGSFFLLGVRFNVFFSFSYQACESLQVQDGFGKQSLIFKPVSFFGFECIANVNSVALSFIDICGVVGAQKRS